MARVHACVHVFLVWQIMLSGTADVHSTISILVLSNITWDIKAWK